MSTTHMDAADRRSNQARAIAYRDEILTVCAELLGAEDRGTLRHARAVCDHHYDVLSFLDGVLCRSFPGVAARLRAGMAQLGWTWQVAEDARAIVNAAHRPVLAAGVTEDTKCERCGGAGFLSAYRHVSGGECFDCGGSGRAEDAAA